MIYSREWLNSLNTVLLFVSINEEAVPVLYYLHPPLFLEEVKGAARDVALILVYSFLTIF